MAIQSSGEFEIIVNSLIMKLDRRLSDQPNNAVLIRAKGTMEESVRWTKAGAKLDQARLKTFSDACDGMRSNFLNDAQLSDQLFDLLDFLEYRLG